MSVDVSEELIEKEIKRQITKDEISNNVRRNVKQEEALPFVSSSSIPLPTIVFIISIISTVL